MNTMDWSSLLAIVACLLLEYHGTNAGVTLLLESPGPIKNSSVLISKVKEASHRESERVTNKILLTKDKDVRDAWRTEKGELVELRYLKSQPTSITPQPVERSSMQIDSSDGFSENSVPGSAPLYDTMNQRTFGGPSHRMRRTFWPFDNLFGYDYPPPPPYGMFGSPVPPSPPFGGGFGLGFPGSYGPYGPYGPPPSLLGLGFTLGM